MIWLALTVMVLAAAAIVVSRLVSGRRPPVPTTVVVEAHPGLRREIDGPPHQRPCGFDDYGPRS